MRVRAIAVDGTSGTILPVDAAGDPFGRPLMYNDPVSDRAILDAISAVAPPASAAHGASSGLARAIVLQETPGTARLVHQADWIAGHISGRFDVSDENNALKTGYDPVAREWPEWIAATGAKPALLPQVAEPGQPTGPLKGKLAARFGLSPRQIRKQTVRVRS